MLQQCGVKRCRNLPNKIVIYDSEFFDEAADDALHVHLQPKRIVYVGNILPGKGQDWAIKAFALVQEDFPETKLYFIGKYDHNGVSTNFKKTVDSLIDELGLEGKVIFEGFKANVDDELRRADIVLNLSESESFSMVCLEALKAGVPLIASDCGGPAELFKHMESGWLVPNKDFVAAAVAIRTLANSNEIRLRFSKRGQESACDV
ncbi:MAG: glycosyltransferase [Chloracidobacterium sp.]|nr:glycosyltransferase [Chloracidobacterium sp.]